MHDVVALALGFGWRSRRDNRAGRHKYFCTIHRACRPPSSWSSGAKNGMSLRAQRSNLPADCFVAFAPRNDSYRGAVEGRWLNMRHPGRIMKNPGREGRHERDALQARHFCRAGRRRVRSDRAGRSGDRHSARLRRVPRHGRRTPPRAFRHALAARPRRGVGREFPGAAGARRVHRDGGRDERAFSGRGGAGRGPAPDGAGWPPGQDPQRRAEFPGTRQRDDPRRHVAGGPPVHRREIIVASLHVPEGVERARRRLRRHRDPARHLEDRLGSRALPRHGAEGETSPGVARAWTASPGS